MQHLAPHYQSEKTGISYTLVGDYYLPDLTMPDDGLDCFSKHIRIMENVGYLSGQVLFLTIYTYKFCG